VQEAKAFLNSKATHALFGPEEETTENETVADAFRERLRTVAGFSNVPEPKPMRDTKGAIVSSLFFASPKEVAQNIVTDIFNKYRNRGAEGWRPTPPSSGLTRRGTR
jgi:hypothetical protein